MYSDVAELFEMHWAGLKAGLKWSEMEDLLENLGDAILGPDGAARKRREMKGLRRTFSKVSVGADVNGDGKGVYKSADGWLRLHHYADAKVNPGEINTALAGFRDEVSDKLGLLVPNVEVQFRDVSFEYDESAGGIFDKGIIHIPLHKYANSPASVRLVVAHEYVHCAIASVCGLGGCPRWLDEGLAAFMSQTLEGRYSSLLKRAVRQATAEDGGKRCLSLAELGERDLFDLARAEVSALAYGQSYSMVEFLVETKAYGWTFIKTLLHAAQQDAAAGGRAGAFGNVLMINRLDGGRLEELWLDWFRQTYL